MFYFYENKNALSLKKKQMTNLTDGDIAPDFTAKIEDGSTISLKGFKGKKKILYFKYVEDNLNCFGKWMMNSIL